MSEETRVPDGIVKQTRIITEIEYEDGRVVQLGFVMDGSGFQTHQSRPVVLDAKGKHKGGLAHVIVSGYFIETIQSSQGNMPGHE